MALVQWASKSLSSRHSLHPTFSHGSTLGLYEVLTGKPYLCDMVADSVVRCFYIEGEKILSLLRSDPAVETFLWQVWYGTPSPVNPPPPPLLNIPSPFSLYNHPPPRFGKILSVFFFFFALLVQESATVMAKLLLPLVFEKMAMQELRALIAERSTMNVFIRGEIMELRHNSISFLLEGFIKAQDCHLELIGPPAALLSPDADSGSLNLGSSGTEQQARTPRAFLGLTFSDSVLTEIRIEIKIQIRSLCEVNSTLTFFLFLGVVEVNTLCRHQGDAVTMRQWVWLVAEILPF